MSAFIKIARIYNALSTQGEGEKYINVEHIVSITKWQNRTNKRIKTIKSRIALSNGEVIECALTVRQIIELIKKNED